MQSRPSEAGRAGAPAERRNRLCRLANPRRNESSSRSVQRQLLRNVEHRAFAGRERLLPPERKGGAVKSGQFSFEDERQRPIRAIGHPNPHRIAGREQREARREIEPDLERSGRSGFGEKRGIVKRQVDAAAVGNQLDAFELHRALPVKSDPGQAERLPS